MIMLFITIVIASTLIGIGVHFIPVGGAPAALSTSAGVPTGAPMITLGMGITGILSAATMLNQSELIVVSSGAIASMLMLAIVMFFSNVIQVIGVGVPIASAVYEKDPITSYKQEEYVSLGTKGHGIPTISYISGIIGGLIGGIGGSLAFYTLYQYILTTNIQNTYSGSVAALLSILLFFVLAVVASYNIKGTIQGFYDKKFREKILSGVISSLLVSIMLALLYTIIIGGML